MLTLVWELGMDGHSGLYYSRIIVIPGLSQVQFNNPFLNPPRPMKCPSLSFSRLLAEAW